MTTAATIDVLGAPDAATVAREVAAALDAPAVHEGRVRLGDVWSIATPDWRVDVAETRGIELRPGEGDVWLSITHANPDPRPLHRLTGDLFAALVDRTPWGLVAESEADGFPPRSRTHTA